MAANNEFRAFHGTVTPDFWVIAIVTDNHADFETLRPLGHVGGVTWIPAFDGTPGDALAIFLYNFPLVVDQDQCVVGRFFWVGLMALTRQGKDSPCICLDAGLRKYGGFVTRNSGSSRHHFIWIVHDPHRAVFGKNH